jgi:2-polyprenyl-6-methoxyphenol hydroxylase-like FAD-dependent oxidoreductase
MPLPHRAAVLVVGGGPAGSATATFLANAGLEVTLVDRAHFPRPKPCAEYLSPEASRVLQSLGVLEAVERAGAAQLSGMRVRAANGAVIDGAFAAAHGFRGFRDRGLALRREVLDALLLSRARDAGTDVHEGVSLESLAPAPRGRGWEVVVRQEGERRTMRADLVIGADGLRSRVARRLGVSRRARWPRRIAFVAHFRGVAGMGEKGEMHVERDGYLGLADVGAGLTNVALVVPTARARAAAADPDAFVRAWIAGRPHLVPRFAHAERVTPVRATGPFAVRSTRAWAPDAVLVGDAADFHDPFTGEGIYAALRGGELAAPFALDAARARTAGASAHALAAYERARRSAFGGKWRVERLIGLAVGVPALMNHAARVLARRTDLADLLVGVTGDFVPAREVLRPGVLWRLVIPPLPSR